MTLLALGESNAALYRRLTRWQRDSEAQLGLTPAILGNLYMNALNWQLRCKPAARISTTLPRRIGGYACIMSLELPSGHPELDVLLVDYEASRDDDRQQQVQLATLFSVGATLLGVAFGLILQAAPFNSAPSALHLNPVVIFFLPMIPLVLLAYAVWFSAGISLRGYYLRALEREISMRAGATIQLHGQLPTPCLAHLEVLLFRTGPGGPIRMRIISNFVGLVSFAGLIAGACLCLVALGSWGPRAVFIAVYLPITALVFWVALTTSINARRFFHALYGQIPQELSRSLDYEATKRPKGTRRLLSYLCIPRPGELLKSVLYIVLATLGLLVYDPSLVTVRDVILFWIVFELLAYQARYAWNDLRGLSQDAQHPAREVRGRIPEAATAPFGILTIEGMICLRIVLAIGLLWQLPTYRMRYGAILFLLALAIISICYELMRSLCSAERSWRSAVTEWAVYIAVSLGYGLRGSAGFWYGSAGRAEENSIVIVFFMCAALGAAGVLVLWLYEADVLTNENLDPSAIPPHLALLHRIFIQAQGRLGKSLSCDGAKESSLAKRDVVLSPWGGFFLTATGLSGVLAADLWAVRTGIGNNRNIWWLYFLGVTIGLCLGWITQLMSAPVASVMSIAAGSIVFLALLHDGVTTATVTILPTLTCLMSYLTMRIGTYERLAAGILYPLRQAKRVFLVSVMVLQRLILGRQTTMLLLSADRGQGRAARSSLHRPSSGPQT